MRPSLFVLLAVIAGPVCAQELPAPSFHNLMEPPVGMPPMPLPESPKPTEAMFELGSKLFADPILSSDRTVACRNCHRPEHGFANPEPRPQGVNGKHALRHAPTLLNRGWGASQRWDGSVPSLEAFVLQPIADTNEMALPLPEALRRLRDDSGYQKAFATAFPDGVTEANVSSALATFVRGIVSPATPVDRFHAGEVAALTNAQKAGLWVFESKGGCWKCHTMPLFTDERFHNTGIGVHAGQAEPGRSVHTHDEADRGRFKTPTLRSVRLTAPYMHDGSLATLPDVLEFYSRGGNPNPQLDARLQPLQLTEQDKRNLIEFLESL